MVIPCLCLFIALSSLFSELVGAKPLHLLTQTALPLKSPAKQKAGYHRHDDTLPLRLLFYFALTYVVRMIETEPQSSR